MQTAEIEKTALKSSVGADEKQSLKPEFIMTNCLEECKSNDEILLKPSEQLRKGILSMRMTDLYETIYPVRTPIIEDLLYPGLFLFAGAPKIGKSFLVTQIGYHVSSGIPLWNRKVRQGTVLCLALEDDFSRIQSRIGRMFGVEYAVPSLVFSVTSLNLQEGLCDEMENFIQCNPDTRLIIIDTLQKVRENLGDKFSYSNDYEIIGQLKKVSDKHGICILVVHHTRKLGAEDRFDTISGTNGLLGCADGALLLQKEKRTDNHATLDVVGRDQQDQRLDLTFNLERCVWELSGEETELWKEPPDPLLEKIALFVEQQPIGWTGSSSELATLIQSDLAPNILSRKLNIGAGRLYREHKIRIGISRSHDGRAVTLWKETPDT
jgi:hypothetical protein